MCKEIERHVTVSKANGNEKRRIVHTCTDTAPLLFFC